MGTDRSQPCTNRCPHYCPMDHGDGMCTKATPRMVVERMEPTGFHGWCKKSRLPIRRTAAAAQHVLADARGKADKTINTNKG